MTPRDRARAADPATWSDAHLHLWDPVSLAPPWLAQAPSLAHGFDLARYRREGGVGGALVLVEADFASPDRPREAETLSCWAREAGRTHAVVAGIEPGGAGFAQELAAARALPAVRGARRVLHGGHGAPGSARFVEDLRTLAAHGIPFDFCVRWSDLPLVERCAREVPEATLVLDHLGNPPLRAGWMSAERIEWQRLVARVAANPRVVVKWSAMFENAGRAIDAGEARPWVEWCLEVFGCGRVLWGSNWPVCFTEAPLARWIEVTAAIAGRLGASEQDAILSANATGLYRPVPLG